MLHAIDIAKRRMEGLKPDGFEIFGLEKSHFLAEARDGEAEAVEEAKEAGLAVRVIIGGRPGFSYTTLLTPEKIAECVDLAAAGSRNIPADPAWAFAAPRTTAAFKWKCADETPAQIPVREKIEKALALESAARGYDARLKRVRKAAYEEEGVRRHIVNSLGVDASFAKTIFGCSIMAVAEDGREAQGVWDFGFAHSFRRLDVETVGRRAAKAAVSLLGARDVPTMRTPCALHPYVAAQFLKVFCSSFFGDSVIKNKSPIAGKMGEKLYSDLINVVDDGLLEGGYNSWPFDGEGVPCRKTPLVKEGVVSNWLTDIFWGARLKTGTTGSSARSQIKEPPSVGISNVYLEKGAPSRKKLLQEMAKGLFITEVSGAHTANPITGDFSVGAAGYLVENGGFAHPVKGFVLSGNLHAMFRDVAGIADDLTFLDNVGSPAILISEMQVSGHG